MHLRAVEINGFKSFAEKINLNFDAGITSIVGPNGSGKSNILDAILWVLGEQSYKNIRAKESLDVIFSGGKNRSPKNIAEVSLYIDNSDFTLPLEIKDIKVTRKLHKTGENEYFINDSRTRLKDINELFLDTGVGKSAYSVIGQGKVERIISSSNKEIKEIIEEAAEIKKVKIRKIESEKKLDKVHKEVEKIDLIIGELRENKDKLEKQSEKALKYLKFQGERDSLAKGIYEKKLDENITTLEKIEIAIQTLRNGISKSQEEFKLSEKKLENVNDEREGLNLEIEAMTNKNIELKKDIDKIINNRTVFSERIKSYQRELDEKIRSSEKIQGKFLLKNKEISDLDIKENIISEDLSLLEEENLKFETFISSKEKIKRETEFSLNLKKERLMTLEVDRLKFIGEAENSSKRMKNSLSRIDNFKDELKDFEKKLSDIRKEILKSREVLSKKTSEYDKIDESNAILEKKITQLSLDMNKIYESMRGTDYTLKRHSSKLQNLVKLEENNEGFYKGVKEILNANIEGVEGAFISLVNIPEKYERAVEAAIPGNLQDLLVKDNKTAKRCIEFLKEKRAGRASFLAFDTIKTGKRPNLPTDTGVVGIASDLMIFPEEYRKAVEFLLGNLLIVNNMETALKILNRNSHRGNIVTLSGELLSSRGRITGGENLKSASSQIFERKKEILKLKSLVNNLKESYQKQEREHKKLIEEMEKTEGKLIAMDELKDTLRGEVKTWNELLEDLAVKEEKLLKGMKIVDLEINEEELYIKEYSQQEKNASGKKIETEELMDEFKKNINIDNKTLIRFRDEIENIKNDFSDKKIMFLNNKERLKQVQKELLREKENLKELSEEKITILKRVEELHNSISTLKENIDNIENNFKNENLRYEKEFFEIKDKKNRYQDLEKKERELIGQVKTFENKIVVENNKLAQEIMRLEKSDVEIKTLKEHLSELQEAESKILEGSLKEAEKSLIKLEVQLKALGTVNLLAIDEFQELKNKYDFITSQRDDLLDSQKSLKNLIKDIENIIEMKFYEAYNCINENFGHMCKEILNNSEGRLEIVGEDSFYQKGIELIVKFNNKKRQSITLLSGGEKSMVAVAFIMAIFMYKPSPFTFFDEIEAALDETNTKRLIRKLKEFTNRSQFILITHNKETMKESDTLYGVTMNKEIGESRIIPVKM